jgi:hypothetical protein
MIPARKLPQFRQRLPRIDYSQCKDAPKPYLGISIIKT